MYNRIGKQKYISPKMLMCGSYTDEYNTVIPDIVGTEKKSFTYQISYSAQLSLVYVTEVGQVIPQDTRIWSL